MAPPRRLLIYSYETTHFIFFYTYASDIGAQTDRKYNRAKATNPIHGVRNFTYVENFSIYFENVWTRFLEGTPRYRKPPGVSQENKYRIYIYNVGDVYGITHPDVIDFANNTASSYITVRNSYEGFRANDDPNPELGSMKVTAAHEFFHAIQFGYSLGGAGWSWWMEASATFMEDEVYDGVNDYRNYLNRWRSRPEIPLDTFNGWHEYGSVLFCKHLSEKFTGPAIIQRIWRQIPTTTALEAIDQVLRRQQSRLTSRRGRDAFASGFVVSNLLPQDPDLGYEEGRLYPAVSIHHMHSSYPVYRVTVGLNHLAATYILFKTDEMKTRTLQITIETSRTPLPIRVLGVILGDSGAAKIQQPVPLRWNKQDKEYKGSLQVANFSNSGESSKVVLIVSNVTWGANQYDNVTFCYSAVVF